MEERMVLIVQAGNMIQCDTVLNRTSQHYASEVPELNRTSQHYTSEVAGLDHSRRCEQGLTNERLPQEGSRQSWEETIK